MFLLCGIVLNSLIKLRSGLQFQLLRSPFRRLNLLSYLLDKLASRASVIDQGDVSLLKLLITNLHLFKVLFEAINLPFHCTSFANHF